MCCLIPEEIHVRDLWWWEESFSSANYETPSTHVCCISFLQTWLYSFTWCFYNSLNYRCLGCIYASLKCMNIHSLCMPNFPLRYMRLVLGLDGHLKFEPKFIIAWKFGAPPIIMYTLEIEPKWGLEHHGGGGWYLDMPKNIIPYEEASLHRSVWLRSRKWCWGCLNWTSSPWWFGTSITNSFASSHYYGTSNSCINGWT